MEQPHVSTHNTVNVNVAIVVLVSASYAY